jgi:hypothetical protein
MEHALWRWFAGSDQLPPKAFLTRIKRLLEIDRLDKAPSGASGVPMARFAFHDEPPKGQGTDSAYTPYNAFCLALALDLLDAGFMQSEVVFVLRYIRGELLEYFEHALGRGGPIRDDRLLARSTRGNAPRVDGRVFMILNKIELVERFPTGIPSSRRATSPPVVLRPQYAIGLGRLTQELDRLGRGERRALVFEIAGTARAVDEALRKAPVMRRGRSSAPAG